MKQTQTIIAAIAIALIGGAIFYANQTTPIETRTLKIFCAGSLLYPMEQVADAFMEKHPEVEVQLEGHGSIQVIRHPVEMDDTADLLVVADYSLIPLMMYDAPLPDGSGNHSDWYVRFATNELVIAFTENSHGVDQITESNWYEVLKEPDVKIGISNPIVDALGYRALQLLQLSEHYYGDTSIFEECLGTWFDPEFESVMVGEKGVIFVPGVQKPVGDRINVRPSSVQIIPLLQSGAVDYAFLYKSNAEQQGFEYLTLPDEVNMANQEMDEVYALAQVKFQHARFQSIGLDRYGKTIYYGFTQTPTALNPEDGLLFAEFLLSETGKRIFEENHHPIYEPSYTDNMDGLPASLKPHLEDDTYR